MVKLNLQTKLLFLILLLIFLFLLRNNSTSVFESFTSNQCGNSLIQKGENIYYHNTNLATIPGRNPIQFNNLDEYVQYIHWQRSQNINCPILSLQHSQNYSKNNKNESSGNVSPTTKLLDATRNDPPYNKNNYPGFDPDNQYIGLRTPLDKMEKQNINGVSPNSMDSNWGGVDFTQNLVNKGYYKDNEVRK